MDIRQHIKKNATGDKLAVFTIPALGVRFEVAAGMSGFAAFRYSGVGRLVAHHSGMTLDEAAGCVGRWMAEYKD